MSRGVAKAITPALLRAWPLPDPEYAGAAGARALVVGGGCRCPGPLLLAGVAVLRAGAGSLQLPLAQDAALPLAMQLPEAKVMGLRCDSRGEIAQSSAEVDACAKQAAAVLIGPGMEVAAATRQLADHLMRASRALFVLDAGALDAALLGRLGRARGPRGVVVVLKSADTCIAAPDGEVWVNREGPVGLGTAGSGDVLAGLIAGLAARGATPAQAAVWGVSLHARAGAVLASRMGRVGLLARELSTEVPALLAH